MDFGVFMFHTDYSMPIVDLAQACEARGFESLWAPEHSHIPLTRKTPFPGGTELPKMYYDAMDPFVILTAAAAATKKLKLGTGVCLIIQRDTIQTAKLAASLDQVSGGRFLFGIGGGWNQDEMEDHGTVYATRFKRMREQVEAMTRDLDRYEARISRRNCRLPADDDLAETRAAAAPPIIVGGAFPHAARRAVRYGNGWIPIAGRANYGSFAEYFPVYKQMLAEAGRSLAEAPITMFGAAENHDQLMEYRDLGVARVVAGLPPENADKTLPVLDRWAELIGKVNS